MAPEKNGECIINHGGNYCVFHTIHNITTSQPNELYECVSVDIAICTIIISVFSRTQFGGHRFYQLYDGKFIMLNKNLLSFWQINCNSYLWGNLFTKLNMELIQKGWRRDNGWKKCQCARSFWFFFCYFCVHQHPIHLNLLLSYTLCYYYLYLLLIVFHFQIC